MIFIDPDTNEPFTPEDWAEVRSSLLLLLIVFLIGLLIGSVLL